MNNCWWKETVVYQIYPRSFCDSNGDGIGDLNGILSKMDYLAELGIGAVWLNPIYGSPNDDMGYDISDYQGIMREFGSMEDFDALLNALHAHGIRLVMDLVLNHSSDEHPWFIESRSSMDNPKRDYYVWRDGKDGKEPNNWASFFTPSAWKFDAQTGQYYLHLFSEKQPDLNWGNERLRGELFQMMNWWLDKGVDGFRLDVINLLDKAEGYPDSAKEPGVTGYVFDSEMFANNPNVYRYLDEMHRKVFAGRDAVAIGETPFVDVQTAKKYVDAAENRLNMLFSFELMDIDSGPSGKWEIIDFDLFKLKQVIGRWQLGLPEGWNSLFWSNHDQPRVVSRFGDDTRYRERSAKMLGLVLHMLKGTPFIYQGEEIGMTNTPFSSLDELRDLESILFYNVSVAAGQDVAKTWSAILRKGRDNARVPMQWDDTAHAGFTSGTPWIKVNPNHKEINVKANLENPDSVFRFYQKLIRLRKENPVVVYGGFRPALESDPRVFAYMREYEVAKWLVIANFTGEKTKAELPDGAVVKEEILSNLESAARIHSGAITLEPYEARVLALA